MYTGYPGYLQYEGVRRAQREFCEYQGLAGILMGMLGGLSKGGLGGVGRGGGDHLPAHHLASGHFVFVGITMHC